jgi:hypothetical protein
VLVEGGAMGHTLGILKYKFEKYDLYAYYRGAFQFTILHRISPNDGKIIYRNM